MHRPETHFSRKFDNGRDTVSVIRDMKAVQPIRLGPGNKSSVVLGR